MLNETFYSDSAFSSARTKRESAKTVLGRLVSWKPMHEPVEGYSVIVPCYGALRRVLAANLVLLARQARRSLRAVIITCDMPQNQLTDLANEVRHAYGELPITWVHPSKVQLATLRMAGSPMTQRWLMLAQAIGQVQTQFAVFHEADAMLGREDLLEQLYGQIRERSDHFVGIRAAVGDGLVEADALADEAELMFDAANLRERASASDVMPTVVHYRGRRLDLPGLVHVQTMAGRTSLMAVGERDVIRAPRAVADFLAVAWRPDTVLGPDTDLPMVPYLRYLGQEPGVLSQATSAFDAAKGASVVLGDTSYDLSHLTREQVMSLVRRADQIEMVLKRAMRPEVKAYFQAVLRLAQRAGG